MPKNLDKEVISYHIISYHIEDTIIVKGKTTIVRVRVFVW
jgi:hypothetical protein